MKSIPIKSRSPQPVPAPVLKALSQLRSHGYIAWLAGGCVRDWILKKTPKDWDVVTNAPLDEAKALFPRHIAVGVAFGILKLPPEKGVQIDIGIFRKEEGYSDLRHPDKIEVGTMETDMARRDFTINALYLDVVEKKIIDGVSGIADLRKGIIRTVGSADQRFSEDALRLLRAARFAAQLGFAIAPATKKAMARHSALLAAISRERIREETFKALQSKRPVAYLKISAEGGLWPSLFGKSFQGKVPSKSVWKKLEKIKSPTQNDALFWLAALRHAGFTSETTEALRLSHAEARTIDQCLAFFDACTTGRSHCSPLVFFALDAQHPGMFAFVLNLSLALAPHENKTTIGAWKWGLKRMSQLRGKASKLPWPKAQELMAEGIVQGPALGKELLARSWDLFWSA